MNLVAAATGWLLSLLVAGVLVAIAVSIGAVAGSAPTRGQLVEACVACTIALVATAELVAVIR